MTEPFKDMKLSQIEDIPDEALYARANLVLNIQDLNGFTQAGFEDIVGAIDGHMTIYRDSFFQYLERLKGYRYQNAFWSSFYISDVYFVPTEQTFHIQVQARLFFGILKDTFEAIIQTDEGGRLYLRLSNNWLPNSRILDVLKDKLKSLIQRRLNQNIRYIPLEINMCRQKNCLYFTPKVETIDIPMGDRNRISVVGIEGVSGQFKIDYQGNLGIYFDKNEFIGSSDPNGKRGKTWTESDSVKLKIRLLFFRDGHSLFEANGVIDIDLNEEETHQIRVQGHTLGEVFERIGLHADIQTQVTFERESGFNVTSHSQWRFNDVRIKGKTHHIEAADLLVNLDTERGLRIQMQQALIADVFKPNLSLNVMEPLIDGPAYFQEILTMIPKARQSVDLESFLYYDEETTRILTRLLALKAAGLRDSSSGLKRDWFSPLGISVHVIFNNTGLKELTVGELLPEERFYQVSQELKQDIRNSPFLPAMKCQYILQLEKNLRWLPFAAGIARTDHRKLLIIDGKIGYIGGINLGDRFLKPDSFHDVMVRLEGPIVREMHQAFIENWLDFSQTKTEERWYLKSNRQLERHCRRSLRTLGKHPIQTALLITDDQRAEIESAIIDILEQAQLEICIEHAYFFHPPTQQSLIAALRRGVQITMIVPVKSNIDIFNLTNTENIRELMQVSQKENTGKVDAYLYLGRPGEWAHMAHTKVITVDKRLAVLGSANLTNRSLRSPFREVLAAGKTESILFNDEMNIYIQNALAVTELNRLLFETDIATACQKLSYQDVCDRLQELGGIKALRDAQLQARLA